MKRDGSSSTIIPEHVVHTAILKGGTSSSSSPKGIKKSTVVEIVSSDRVISFHFLSSTHFESLSCTQYCSSNTLLSVLSLHMFNCHTLFYSLSLHLPLHSISLHIQVVVVSNIRMVVAQLARRKGGGSTLKRLWEADLNTLSYPIFQGGGGGATLVFWTKSVEAVIDGTLQMVR